MTRTASLVAVLVLAGALAGCTGTRASGITSPIRGAGSSKILRATSKYDGPAKGRTPAIISYTSTASENMSDWCPPMLVSSCSGAL